MPLVNVETGEPIEPATAPVAESSIRVAEHLIRLLREVNEAIIDSGFELPDDLRAQVERALRE